MIIKYSARHNGTSWKILKTMGEDVYYQIEVAGTLRYYKHNTYEEALITLLEFWED